MNSNQQKKEQAKFEMLKEACSKFLEENNDVKRAITIEYFNKNCEDLFPELINIIKQYPSLVYLDQNGIKFLSDKYLLELEKTKQTDFLYFVSSSYFWRLGETEDFKKHVDIDMELAKKDPYKFIHRNIIEHLRNRLPKNTNHKLHPFSIKKGKNIHGIIFGASHPRAVDKFLTIAWKRNETNGEANFDIDDDSNKIQLDAFEGQRLTKVEGFKERVKEKILNKSISNNNQLFNYVLAQGHICSHASDCLREMKRNKLVTYEGSSPLVNYANVIKVRRIVEYRLLD